MDRRAAGPWSSARPARCSRHRRPTSALARPSPPLAQAPARCSRHRRPPSAPGRASSAPALAPQWPASAPALARPSQARRAPRPRKSSARALARRWPASAPALALARPSPTRRAPRPRASSAPWLQVEPLSRPGSDPRSAARAGSFRRSTGCTLLRVKSPAAQTPSVRGGRVVPQLGQLEAAFMVDQTNRVLLHNGQRERCASTRGYAVVWSRAAAAYHTVNKAPPCPNCPI